MVEFRRLMTLCQCLMLHLVQDLLLEDVGVLQTLREDIESFLDVVYGPLDHRQPLLKRLHLVVVIFGVAILRIIRSWAALVSSRRAWIISHRVWEKFLVFKDVPSHTYKRGNNVLAIVLLYEFVTGLGQRYNLLRSGEFSWSQNWILMVRVFF